MKIHEVVDSILAYHPHIDNYDGCDNYKCGDPECECTGVVTAIAPTIDVIRKAVELGANLIVVHEPTFYSTPDYPCWRADFENSVYNEKRKLLDGNGIAVWRDHDHMHANRPDSIFTGVIKKLGWEPYRVPCTDFFSYEFELPETTVGELGEYLKEKLNLNGLRFVGNKDAKLRRVAIVGHLVLNAFGTDYTDGDGYLHEYATGIIKLMESGVEAIIPGEVIDWTTVSYARDAVQLGKTKAVYNVGHFNWEEPGMEYMAEWLPGLIDNAVPVTFVKAGDIYNFM